MGEVHRTWELASGPRRLIALDRLRGLAVIGMILVNNPGDPAAAPRQIQHAGWYGITFADTVAPAFLWVIGFVLELSLARRLAGRGADIASARRTWFAHVARRVAVLFVIGIGISIWARLFPAPSWAALVDHPLMGILQRIALAYGLAAALLTSSRSPSATAIVLLALHTGVMFAGAGFPSAAAVFAQETNVATRIDRILLGAHSSNVHTLLTVVPAAATVLLGAAIGRAMRLAGAVRPNARISLQHAVVPLAAGLLMALVIPITRFLWSPSFALITAGITAAAFSLLSLVGPVGEAGPPGRDPVAAVGANPLLMFALSELARRPLEAFGAAVGGAPWRSFQRVAYEGLARGLPAGVASLVYSVAYLIPFLLLAVFLARRRIFVKI